MSQSDNTAESVIALRVRQSKNFLLDLLFPVRCLSCGKEKLWICQPCLEKITLRSEHVCGVCEKTTTPDGRTCFACRKKSSLDALVVCASYRHALVSHAVHVFKYRFIADLHPSLGKLLVKSLLRTELPLPELVIPVPLHPRRLRWRGFNQSELLAAYLAKNITAPFEIPLEKNVLARKRWTKPQKGIKDFHLRKKNLAEAFRVCDSQSIKGKRVLLVDDVATTGSTLFECAKVLKGAGAKEVFAIVIARQELKAKA